MKTISLNLYKFNELTTEAKEKAINDFRETQYENICLDMFSDCAYDQIKDAGFEGKIKLQYSLGYSQGDGLSFSCDYLNSDILNSLFVDILGTGKQKTIDTIINNCSFSNSGNSGRYCYASSGDIDFCLDHYSNNDLLNVFSIVEEVKEKIQNIYIDLCNELEKQGYDEIEFQNSDEYIIETIECNDYDFLIDGSIY